MFNNGIALRPIVVWDLIYANVIQVINLRSIRPLDRATINASVRKTSRLVTVKTGFLNMVLVPRSGYLLIIKYLPFLFRFLSPPLSIYPYMHLFSSAVHLWLRRAFIIWMLQLRRLQELMFQCLIMRILRGSLFHRFVLMDSHCFPWWFSSVLASCNTGIYVFKSSEFEFDVIFTCMWSFFEDLEPLLWLSNYLKCLI